VTVGGTQMPARVSTGDRDAVHAPTDMAVPLVRDRLYI